MQYGGGVITFLYPRLSLPSRVSLLPYHRFVGVLLVVLPTLTACLGVLERLTFKAAATPPSRDLREEVLTANALGIALLVGMCASLFVLIGPLRRQNEREAADAEEGEESAEVEEVAEGERQGLLTHSDSSEGSLDDKQEGVVDVLLTSTLQKRRHSREKGAAPILSVSLPSTPTRPSYGAVDRTPQLAARTLPPPSRGQQREQVEGAESTAERLPSIQSAETAETPESSPDSAPLSMWGRYKGVSESGAALFSP